MNEETGAFRARLDSLERSDEEHDRQFGEIARSLGAIEKGLANVERQSSWLIERYLDDHPSKVQHVESLRAKSEPPSQHQWKFFGLLIVSLSAAVNVIAELVKALLRIH